MMEKPKRAGSLRTEPSALDLAKQALKDKIRGKPKPKKIPPTRKADSQALDVYTVKKY